MNKLSLSSSPAKLLYVLLIFFSACIVYSCSQSERDNETGSSGATHIPKDHTFVGDESCQSCHEKEWNDWQGSHHDYAMAEASEEMVRGDFSDVTFEYKDDTYRFYRENEKYMVEAPGPDGKSETYEVVYTFGWEPLQQYLVNFGKGKYQVLHASWDTEQKRWFMQYAGELIEPGEWMHWTKQSMNWNTMCAECHSTNLKQNYIAEADSFHTSWDVINVSCEACHGPGGEHVEFMNTEGADLATPERIREDLDLPLYVSQLEEINTCAPCHSLREKLTDEYVHGDEYLDHYDPSLPHPPEYFANGQIRDEVYVYGSFLQSKMYTLGIKCTNCHDPHTLRIKEPITDNKLCMNCHVPSYNTPEHHFHEQNTEASQCVNCHMTGRTYMGNDYRRDHSFRVPRPDLSEEFGTPNACNDCHDDQSAAWSARAIEDWYGPDRNPDYADKLTKAHAEEATPEELKEWINDAIQPELIRATLVWYAGQFPTEESVEILRQGLQSDQSIIRTSASKAIENLPLDLRRSILTEAVSDSIRAVRLPAARMLATFSEPYLTPSEGQLFRNALQEYKDYLDINEYFPQGQMNRGQFFEQQGEIDKAIEAYQKSLEKDPGFNPARINLAYLYNRWGDNNKAEELLRIVIDQEPEYGQAYYSLGLLLAEQQQLEEAIDYFEQAAGLMPEYGRLYYNWAVALQTIGRPQEAEEVYLDAINLEPENSDYRYGLISLYMQQEHFEKAQKHAEILYQLNPNNPQIQQLIQVIEQQMN